MGYRSGTHIGIHLDIDKLILSDWFKNFIRICMRDRIYEFDPDIQEWLHYVCNDEQGEEPECMAKEFYEILNEDDDFIRGDFEFDDDEYYAYFTIVRLIEGEPFHYYPNDNKRYHLIIKRLTDCTNIDYINETIDEVDFEGICEYLGQDKRKPEILHYGHGT